MLTRLSSTLQSIEPSPSLTLCASSSEPSPHIPSSSGLNIASSTQEQAEQEGSSHFQKQPALPSSGDDKYNCQGRFHRSTIPKQVRFAYKKTYTSVMPIMTSRYAGLTRPHSYLDMSSVAWDLRDHQSAVSRNHHSISSRVLCEPATNPPLPFLSITSRHLPLSIKVYALNNLFVAVVDVYSSIYRSLRTNITSSEFNRFLSTNGQRCATRAYEERYRRQRSIRIYEEEKRGGMKRVDFLMDHTQFLGISNSRRHLEEWQLHVA